MRKFFLLTATVGMLLMSACETPQNVTYLLDAKFDTTVAVNKAPDIVIQTNDLLRIYVGSQTPEAAIQFNQETNGIAMTPTGGTTNSRTDVPLGYRVDSKGDITFPVLGKIHVAGLSHYQLSLLIENRLKSEGHIKDPVVTVNLLNFTVSVLGEVSRPGQIVVNGNKITIFEALGQAGDISIYGMRDKVYLIREQDGKRTIGKVDLTTDSIFDSPYYYLAPNDVVYVEPNNHKKRSSGNNAALTMSWISAGVSLLSTISMMIYYFVMIKNLRS